MFYSINVLGQSACAVDFVPNSNQIIYNQNIIDSTLEASKYDAFFLGESHTIDFEPEFKFNFIKHLNSLYGIRDVFMEIGFSAAYFFNQYLQTGDTSIIKENRLGYFWGHYKTFWPNLYNYNKTLPDSLKIRIHGVDFERTEVFSLIDKIRDPNQTIPVYLQSTFKIIHELSKAKNFYWTDKDFSRKLQDVRRIFIKNRNDFKKLYKQDYSILNAVLTNATPAITKVNPRNKRWFQNFEQIITENKIKKFIGFFGAAHTRYNNKTSPTVALKTSTFFKGNILNIATVYSHFISTGGSNQIVEYGFKEKEIFNKFYNPACRAVLIHSKDIPKFGSKTESDFILFAKEIVDR